MSKYKKELFKKYLRANAVMKTRKKPIDKEEAALFRLKERIDRCMSALEQPYETVIRNSFLIEDNRFWWVGILSERSYYRYRQIGLKQFFHYYYGGLK